MPKIIKTPINRQGSIAPAHMAVCHSVFLCLSVSLTLSLRRIEILICKNWVALLSRSNFLSTRKCCHHLCHDRPKIRCDFCKHVVNFTSTRSFECSPKSLNVTGPKLKATLYDWDRSDLHCIQSSKVIREPIPFEIVFFLFFFNSSTLDKETWARHKFAADKRINFVKHWQTKNLSFQFQMH